MSAIFAPELGSLTAWQCPVGHYRRNGGLLAPGRLSGSTSVNAVDGVAIFPSLSIDQIGNGYTLVATVSGVTGTESQPLKLGPWIFGRMTESR